MTRTIQRIKSGADKGFTLIELLIVIVVLGVLAGIAIFAVGQFQGDAEDACTSANSRINDTASAAAAASGGSAATYTNGSTCANDAS